MLLSFSSVAISLLLAPAAAQAGPIVVPRQAATAPFDCGQVRVDSPNTTYSGFVAADLDTERRYVVTRTASQKRLLTRFENNTLFTLNSNGKNPTFGATFGFYWDTPPGKPNFAASAQNYAYFNSVAASKAGDRPAKLAASINEAGTNPSTGGKRDHESESAIFYMDPNGKDRRQGSFARSRHKAALGCVKWKSDGLYADVAKKAVLSPRDVEPNSRRGQNLDLDGMEKPVAIDGR
ncbi:hypothetical protein B0T25DRAFT_514406 [Lasiosphaeria hispida]|uniref:Secreted protein n=1 Tax=Lasiosphaeria hispida TaxID=260671 RepID=A0AAJ0HPB4_9PEZI|nr:hypothetical protein B0T25DRAFT_514406 [Lasiosphaeria hispida]